MDHSLPSNSDSPSPSSRNNTILLESLEASIVEFDAQYKQADFDTKMQLQDQRNQLFSDYSELRLKLLESAVVCSAQDIKSMQGLRNQINQAAGTEALVDVAGNLASFLMRLKIRL